MNLKEEILRIGKQAKKASFDLSNINKEIKEKALKNAAKSIENNCQRIYKNCEHFTKHSPTLQNVVEHRKRYMSN